MQWEQQRCDEAVADIFGYYSLQLGLPLLQGLRANRMPHRWQALESAQALQDWEQERAQNPAAADHGLTPVLLADPVALPFAEACLDLLVLPHTLETSSDPHAVLREAARVLVPEGRLVICGLNPMSLLGLQRRLERGNSYLPGLGWGPGYGRLRDWLRLLAFEIEAVQFGGYVPAVQSARWLRRWQVMDRVGPVGWPVLGGVYCVVAVKRVVGMRLLGPSWKARSAMVGAPVAARRQPADAAASVVGPGPDRKTDQGGGWEI